MGFTKNGPEQRAERRVNQMTQNLDLSPEQQSQIKNLLIDQFTEIQNLKASFGEDHDGLRAAIKPVRKKYRTEIDGLLSENQLAQKKELNATRRMKRLEHSGMNPEEKAKMMTEQLDEIVTLTPEQKPQVLSLNIEKIASLQAALEKSNGDPEILKAERKIIRKNYKEKLQQILSEEQQQARKNHMKHQKAIQHDLHGESSE